MSSIIELDIHLSRFCIYFDVFTHTCVVFISDLSILIPPLFALNNVQTQQRRAKVEKQIRRARELSREPQSKTKYHEYK